jgi:hypothetical protein
MSSPNVLIKSGRAGRRRNPPTVSPLIRRVIPALHWLAGEIEATHDRLHKMIIIRDLEELDSVILKFDPTHQVEAIKPKAFRPTPDWSRRGEMTETVLSILRQAAEPLTSRDIALELLVTRALDKDDQKLLALMTKRVGVTLRLQRINGVVRSSQGTGQYMVWEIVV